MTTNDDHTPLIQDLLFFQEDSLGRDEAEMQNRESNLIKRERAFIGRRLALSDYYDWIEGEESKWLVELELLAEAGKHLGDEFNQRFPMKIKVDETDYQALEVCKKSRKMLIQIRRKTLEEREKVLGRRNREIENGEEELAKYELMFKQREDAIKEFRAKAEEARKLLGIAQIPRGLDEAAPNVTLDYPAGGLGSQRDQPRDSGSHPDLEALLPQDPSISVDLEVDLSGLTEQEMTQKRQHERVAMELVVSTVSEHNFFTGFTKNISRGGIFVATHELLPIGTEVALKFYLPGGELILANSVVQWVRELVDDQSTASGMGLRFVSLSDQEQAAIDRFMEYYREPIFYDF